MLRSEDFGEPVAEAGIRLREADGTTIPATIRVGKPYEEADGSCWRCPVEVAGYRGRYADIAGVDSLQALCLALALVRTELSNFRARGGDVLSDDSDDDLDINAAFGVSSLTSSTLSGDDANDR